MTHSTPLSRILENKRTEVAQRERLRPLSDFREQLLPSDRNFAGGFILECKKASPSEGLLRPDFNVVEIAKTYTAFAGAISVLTDNKFFEGSLEFLPKVRESVSCPVLCKDFIVSPYQVYEARLYGADMILLMLSVVDDELYQACAQVAQELNLDILTEIHDEEELNRAIALGAKIIGINNRDFSTLKVDLNTSRRLLSMIPNDRMLIVESGFQTHVQIVEFKNRVQGFLIGSSLMKQKRLDLAVRDLIFGRVKICGLTREEDAQAAYELGAGFGGLIFAGESPRCVSFEQAQAIRQAAPLRWVGVFVNASIEQISDYAKKLDLFAVQLHGEESDTYIQDLREQLGSKIEIWRRVIPSPLAGEGQGEGWGGDRWLFDTPHTALRGGTGQSFDWSLIPSNIPKDKVILSGGLGPDNIQEADKLGFWALDVNSKVEHSPGAKSRVKLSQVFDAINSRIRS